ncbi:MAG: CinA family protein [Clostridiales bacterium]|nr:CinA family protein [Clostridiales bacterium]
MSNDTIYDKAFDVVEELRNCDLKISFAESLTGGMISSRLVDIVGASDVLKGSVVSYTNEIKMNVLGVNPETIETYTEVSEQCACEMAQGVMKLTGSDIAISATGYAGTYELPKEVDLLGEGLDDSQTGTVWFGFATEDGVSAVCQYFPGTRDAVRAQAVEFVFDMILEYISENYE